MSPLTTLAIVGLVALGLFLLYILFCVVSAIAYKHIGWRVEYSTDKKNIEK